MARPKKDGLDYFPHDTDSVNDEKIEALRMLYGNDGYAFYFILLERIYRTKDAELDVSDAETIQILSKKVGINTETFYRMLETCFKRGCFDRDSYENRGVLTSEGVKKRVAPVIEKREKMRQKYISEKEEVSDAETDQKPDKVKESREEKSKGNKKKRETIPFREYVHLTQQEHDRLVDEYGEERTDMMLEELDNYKGSSGRKYKDDNRAIRKWVIRKILERKPIKPKIVLTEEQQLEKRRDELDGILSLRAAYWERKGEPETFYNAEKEYEDVERRLRALENTG